MIKNIEIEKFFLYVSLFFGLIYVLILPPFQSVDEASHYYRGYSVISGNFHDVKVKGQVGNYLPSSLIELSNKFTYLIKNVDNKVSLKQILESFKIKLVPEQRTFISFANTALYSPVPYITQIPGMFIAKSIGGGPLLILYLGRLSNLLFYILIIYYSIKIIPFYKLPLLLIALAPMTLSLASALTTDVFVIGLNIFWVAYILKLYFSEEKISNKQIIFLNIIALCLSFSKHYLMLIPLLFLLPKSKFEAKKYFIYIISIISIAIFGCIMWQVFAKGLYVPLNEATNMHAQLSYILHNPLTYLIILIKSSIIKLGRIYITMVGVLGWQDTRLDFLTYILYPFLIYLTIAYEKSEHFILFKWQKTLIGATVIISYIIIATFMYLSWTPVGYSIILGLNGKYFTPIILPFLLLFHNSLHLNIDKNYIKWLIFFFLILILLSSDLSILNRFYGITPNLYYKI